MSTEQAIAPTGPVELEGQHTRLREFATSDLDAVHALVGDDRVTSLLSFDSRSRDEAQAMLDGMVERAQIRPRSEYYMAITSRDADDVVGFARLAFSGVQAAKLGYAVAYDHQCKGYASGAVATLLDFAFGPLALHRVTAAIGPQNAASIVVVERLGFTREGVLRDHVHTNGAWRDSVLFSMLADEWGGDDPARLTMSALPIVQ